MHWSEVWHGHGLGARSARIALTPLSWLYCAGWNAYLATYRAGLKKPVEPHRPVVCIGSLIAGGSGKTPFTLFVAGQLEKLGREVVVSCSGYGSPASQGAALAPEGELDAGLWGDEPAMARWLAPELPIVVGRDRVAAARLVSERFPRAVMLMDDGFQHLPLRKHVSIVLEPGCRNGRCLPAGPYREPRSGLSRANLRLPDGFELVVKDGGFITVGGQVQFVSISGQAQALCALGEPSRFFDSLSRQGLELVQVRSLRDHDPLSASELLEGLDPKLPLVVTAKDWVKLRRRPDASQFDVFVALYEVRAEPEAEFREWLARKLDGISHAPSSR